MADSFELYNPSTDGQAFNKSITINGDYYIDGKAYYYNRTRFLQRPYLSKAEVIAHLTLNQRKDGQLLYINTGGTLNSSTGLIDGGTNDWFRFKDGIANEEYIVPLTSSLFDLRSYIQYAPVAVDDADAASQNIPPYTLYKTPTGELRYKLFSSDDNDSFDDTLDDSFQ